MLGLFDDGLSSSSLFHKIFLVDKLQLHEPKGSYDGTLLLVAK